GHVGSIQRNWKLFPPQPSCPSTVWLKGTHDKSELTRSLGGEGVLGCSGAQHPEQSFLGAAVLLQKPRGSSACDQGHLSPDVACEVGEVPGGGPAPPLLIPSLLAAQVNGVNVVKVGHKQVVSLIRQGGNHLVMKVVSVSRKPESEDVVRKKGECRAEPPPIPPPLRFESPSRLLAALVGLEEGALFPPTQLRLPPWDRHCCPPSPVSILLSSPAWCSVLQASVCPLLGAVVLGLPPSSLPARIALRNIAGCRMRPLWGRSLSSGRLLLSILKGDREEGRGDQGGCRGGLPGTMGTGRASSHAEEGLLLPISPGWLNLPFLN
ncbi:hypothetical protein E2320_004451, partial [Naja naja]